MVGHQAVCDKINTGGIEIVVKSLQEESVVFAFEKDRLLVVASIENVIIFARKDMHVFSAHGKIPSFFRTPTSPAEGRHKRSQFARS